MADQYEYHLYAFTEQRRNLTWWGAIKLIRTVWTISCSITFPEERDARLVPTLKLAA